MSRPSTVISLEAQSTCVIAPGPPARPPRPPGPAPRGPPPRSARPVPPPRPPSGARPRAPSPCTGLVRCSETRTCRRDRLGSCSSSTPGTVGASGCPLTDNDTCVPCGSVGSGPVTVPCTRAVGTSWSWKSMPALFFADPQGHLRRRRGRGRARVVDRRIGGRLLVGLLLQLLLQLLHLIEELLTPAAADQVAERRESLSAATRAAWLRPRPASAARAARAAPVSVPARRRRRSDCAATRSPCTRRAAAGRGDRCRDRRSDPDWRSGACAVRC